MATDALRNAERKRRALSLHKEGFSIAMIASQIGVTQTTARCWVDPEYHQSRKRQVQERRRRMAGPSSSRRVVKVVADDGPGPAPVPKDLRDVTGQLLGDPLPGRSAFDKRGTAS